MQTFDSMKDALLVASRVLAGEIEPKLGCNMIAAVGENLGHPRELSMFALLAHEQSGHESLGITAASCVPDILAACRDLLAPQA